MRLWGYEKMINPMTKCCQTLPPLNFSEAITKYMKSQKKEVCWMKNNSSHHLLIFMFMAKDLFSTVSMLVPLHLL